MPNHHNVISLHRCTDIGPLPTGNRLAFPDKTHFQLHQVHLVKLDVGTWGKIAPRTNALQQLLAEHRMVAAALWSRECFFGIAWVHWCPWREISADIVTFSSWQISYTCTCWPWSWSAMEPFNKTVQHATTSKSSVLFEEYDHDFQETTLASEFPRPQYNRAFLGPPWLTHQIDGSTTIDSTGALGYTSACMVKDTPSNLLTTYSVPSMVHGCSLYCKGSINWILGKWF